MRVARSDQHVAVFFKIGLGGERAMAGHDLGVVVGGLVPTARVGRLG
jgi:hypothetical protein